MRRNLPLLGSECQAHYCRWRKKGAARCCCYCCCCSRRRRYWRCSHWAVWLNTPCSEWSGTCECSKCPRLVCSLAVCTALSSTRSAKITLLVHSSTKTTAVVFALRGGRESVRCWLAVINLTNGRLLEREEGCDGVLGVAGETSRRSGVSFADALSLRLGITTAFLHREPSRKCLREVVWLRDSLNPWGHFLRHMLLIVSVLLHSLSETTSLSCNCVLRCKQ